MLGILTESSTHAVVGRESIMAAFMDMPMDLMLIIVLLSGLCFQTLTIVYLYTRLRQRDRDEADDRFPVGTSGENCCDHPDAVVVRLELDGVITGLSRGARRYFGVRGEGAVGRTLVGALVPARERSGRDLATAWHDVYRGEDEVREIECECLAGGGKTAWMRWIVRRVQHHGMGAHVQQRGEFLCLGMEVTRDRERDLEHDLASQAMEQTVEGVGLASLDGTLQFVNRAWAEMHGYANRKDLVGGNIAMFHSPEQMIQEVIPFNREVVAKGAKQGEMGHVRRDGSVFTCWMSLSLVRDAQGGPQGYLAIARDISEEQHAQEEARRSLAWMTSLLESTDDIIMVADRTTRALFYNASYADIIKRTIGEEMRPGLRLTDHLRPENKVLWEEYYQRVLAGEQTRFEYELVFPGGEVRVFDVTLNPVRYGGEVNGFSLFARDITSPVKVQRSRGVVEPGEAERDGPDSGENGP